MTGLYFALLGSASVKAANKHVVEIDDPESQNTMDKFQPPATLRHLDYVPLIINFKADYNN